MPTTIERNQQSEVVKKLSTLLADTYTLTLKTQNFHWNVKGPHFSSYHKLFEEQYDELSEANDVLAERIRALGERTPASFEEYRRLTQIKENKEAISAEAMIKDLANDHSLLGKSFEEATKVAEQGNDPGTADFFTQRVQAHQKAAWMLSSSL